MAVASRFETITADPSRLRKTSWRELAIFTAAIACLKRLNRPRASQPVHVIDRVLDGAAKPVGGSSEATIKLAARCFGAFERPARIVERAEKHES